MLQVMDRSIECGLVCNDACTIMSMVHRVWFSV